MTIVHDLAAPPMAPAVPTILAVNCGSSTLRACLYRDDPNLQPLFEVTVDRIGRDRPTIHARFSTSVTTTPQEVSAANHESAARLVLDMLDRHHLRDDIHAIGYRVVHGLHHTEPQHVTPSLLEELRTTATLDSEHAPAELRLISALGDQFPGAQHIACFDTSFHATLPRIARLLAIPRRYQSEMVQRFGFHGLSYSYLLQELNRLGDPAASRGRVVMAHLGSGSSLTAVLHGRSVETTMGFTPAGGMMMSTRTGDIDPSLLYYLSKSANLDIDALQKIVTHESGLLGVSEISADVRDLLAKEASDVRAAEALALYCYQAKKLIGSLTAVLGGLDTLVFSGGIGENATQLRSRICSGLDFLGVSIDEIRNANKAELISAQRSRVNVRVIATDEGLMIARLVRQVLRLNEGK